MINLLCGNGLNNVKGHFSKEKSKLCMLCDMNEIEDVQHFIICCDFYSDERNNLMRILDRLLINNGLNRPSMSINHILQVLFGNVPPGSDKEQTDLFLEECCLQISAMYDKRVEALRATNNTVLDANKLV